MKNQQHQQMFLFPRLREQVLAEQENTQTVRDEEFLKQCSLSKCRIPIPTLKDPNNKNFDLGQKIYLTGLTWNNTIIDVYIDGAYVGNAIVRNDEKSNTANFYLEFENNLSTGSHNWSVIAWSLNKKDRSMISATNSFVVLDKTSFETKNIETAEIKEDTAISSISEEKETIDVISEESDAPVSINNSEQQTDVNVTSTEEKDMLVVDSSLKSDNKEESQVAESKNEEPQITEKIQNATPSEEVKQEVQNDLETQPQNIPMSKKKIGIILLSALVVFSGLLMIFFRKKK